MVVPAAGAEATGMPPAMLQAAALERDDAMAGVDFSSEVGSRGAFAGSCAGRSELGWLFVPCWSVAIKDAAGLAAAVICRTSREDSNTADSMAVPSGVAGGR